MDEQQSSNDTSLQENEGPKPSSGQVMDIQTPKPVSTPEAAEANTPAATSAPVTETPVTPGTSSTDAATGTGAAEASTGEAATPDQATTNPSAVPPQKAKKSGKPMLVITVAIIVAIGLAGLVVYTFMKTKKDTMGTNKTASSTSTQTATKPLASPADVDSTTKDLETNLNKVDDTKDFPAADLSDKTLGL